MTRRVDNPDTDADIEVQALLKGNAGSGFVMVAGAGAGKTTSLIKALAYVGKTYGVEMRRHSQQVACITYTEIAVGEIGDDVGNDPLFHVSTIHSFLWALVRPFQKDIASWVSGRIEERLRELQLKRDKPRTQHRTREKIDRETSKLEQQREAVRRVSRFKYESGSDYSAGLLGHDDIIRMGSQLVNEQPLLQSVIACKYPFAFVDESQDTFPSVVQALCAVARANVGKFCLGFFGDPMQQIYMSGVGEIVLEPGWKKIRKPENFRCPARVLSVINEIRKRGDGLQQVHGRQELVDGVVQAAQGSAQAFVLPADDHRSDNLERVRAWLATRHADDLWMSNVGGTDVRILVIVHRMAAARLKFLQLYAACNDGVSESFSTGFREGNLWALRPFRDVLLPMYRAFAENRQFDLMSLVRTYCPQLQEDRVAAVKDTAGLLALVKANVEELARLMSPNGGASVLDVLRCVRRTGLTVLDERFTEYLEAAAHAGTESSEKVVPDLRESPSSDEAEDVRAMKAYLACPVTEVFGYYTYIQDQSPYSTQQGIKGAEFPRVLVVLDDEEGRHPQFSYEKLLGFKEPSKTDRENEQQKKETVVDRTRRLLYVCCSRAMKDLAVVLYSHDVNAAAAKLKTAGLFGPSDVYTLDDIP